MTRPTAAWRETVVRRTAPHAALLARGPRWVPAVLALGLVVGGLLLPAPVGAVLLVLVAGLLGWLLLLGWDVHPPATRLPRLLVIALLLGAAVLRLLR